MPASQLSQLKAALTGAGLDRKSISKKDKKTFKKGGARETDRQKKFDKLDDIRKGLNKFDERETKIKHDVGGRTIKGAIGRPSASKQAGLDQRKKNLLPEHQLRNHTGTFNDRRFGENNPGLSVDERMQERYTRERQRGQGKKGMFNLEDDEQDLLGFDEGQALGYLTHGGRNVMDLQGDDFMAQGLGDDDEDDDERGNIGRRVVDRAHFGGFGTEGQEEEGEERKKSKQEVMAEVMAKSKEYKFARQQQQEIDAGMREALDADINDLQALLQESVPASKSTVTFPTAGPSRAQPATSHPKGVDGEYDQLVRELAFDTRAKPKNRTKTEEELAVEEKERLEAAEAKRLRRMRGEESDDEEAGGRKKRRKEKRGDADDLDDDFEEDDLLGPGLTREGIEAMKVPKVTDVDESDEEGEEGSDEEEDGEEGDSDEDGEGSDNDDEEDDEEEDDEDSEVSDMADLDEEEIASEEDDDMAGNIVKGKKKSGSSASSKGKTKEIPYTFPCPANIEEFEDILESLDDEVIPTVVQRIRALHHPSLAQGNKEKLQDFLGVLIDLILLLASRPIPAFTLISSLQPHLIALVKLNPITAAFHFTAKLSLMQKNLTRGLARGPNNPEARTWPGAAELTLLRIIGTVWSTSDFSHPVVVPALLLMGQYLSQARIRTVSDLAAGVFMVSIIAQYETESKRIVPEAVNFIAAAVLALLPRRKDAASVSTYPDLQSPSTNLYISSTLGSSPNQPVNLAYCLAISSESSDMEADQSKVDLLSVTLRLIETYATMYSSHDAFIELLSPIRVILESSRVAKVSPAIKTLHNTTLSTLTRQIHFAQTARQPLALQSHKPLAIRSHTPKFESDFAPGKHYDPDADRNATAKLKSLYKKEKKGAIRELRKDNRFLAGVKSAEAREKDTGYKERMRKVEGSIQVERAEEKEMEREKKREKRRAGK